MGYMSDFRASPMSWAAVDSRADQLRQDFRLDDVPYFPVVEFVEILLGNKLNVMRFEVATSAEMGGRKGWHAPEGSSFAYVKTSMVRPVRAVRVRDSRSRMNWGTICFTATPKSRLRARSHQKS